MIGMTGTLGGRAKCGHCGAEPEQWEHPEGGVLLLCQGCGIVCGQGAAAALVVEKEIAAKRANRIDAEPGTVAMRVRGGPST